MPATATLLTSAVFQTMLSGVEGEPLEESLFFPFAIELTASVSGEKLVGFSGSPVPSPGWSCSSDGPRKGWKPGSAGRFRDDSAVRFSFACAMIRRDFATRDCRRRQAMSAPRSFER